MKRLLALGTAVLVTLPVLSAPWPAAAQSTGAGDAPADRPSPLAPSPAHRYFTDVELINQDGQPMRFYSDLLQGHSVVISVFFTHCTGVCPVLAQKMASIQERLADELGKKLYLISISVDPTTDTPARLKEYARQVHAKPGWYFLTGKKANVDFALQRIGQSVTDPRDHTNILIVGNEPTGLWKKAFGLAKTEDLIQLVEGVLNDPGGPVPHATKFGK